MPLVLTVKPDALQRFTRANLSDLSWSEINEYSIIEEYQRAEKIVMVANYQYAKRIDQNRLQVLFKELMKAPIFLLVLISLTIFYANIFVL